MNFSVKLLPYRFILYKINDITLNQFILVKMGDSGLLYFLYRTHNKINNYKADS